eukprot:13706115-Alexandrium_andersonii.AAC.1
MCIRDSRKGRGKGRGERSVTSAARALPPALATTLTTRSGDARHRRARCRRPAGVAVVRAAKPVCYALS